MGGWGLRVRDVHIQAALMLSVNKRKVGPERVS